MKFLKGRKQRLGIFGLIVVTVMAFYLKGTYAEWGVLFVGLLTAMGVAIQDDKRTDAKYGDGK